MSRMKYTFCSLLGILLLAGCTPNEATVSGKVTLDGTPLAKGNIAFYGGEKSALAMGSIDSSGNYQLLTGTATGLKPGSYQVTVVANDVIEPTQPFGSPMPKLITPPKYSDGATSGLTAEVKPGSNVHNFDLKSMP